MGPEIIRIRGYRHPESEANKDQIINGRGNEPLTSSGWLQANEAAEKLEGMQIKAIYSSPLQRATNFAEIIANVVGIPRVILLEGLIEKDWGVITGMRDEEALDYAKANQSRILETVYGEVIILDVEGGEDFPTLFERGETVLNEIKQRHLPGETVIVVSHGKLLQMMYGAYIGLTWEEALITVPPLENTGFYEFTFGDTNLPS